jgi:hypothetical protein
MLSNIRANNNTGSGLSINNSTNVQINNVDTSSVSYHAGSDAAQQIGLYVGPTTRFVNIKNIRSQGNILDNFSISSNTGTVIDGVLKSDITNKSTNGDSVTNLNIVFVPQYAYNYWRGLKLRAAGTKTGANGTKTISLFLGPTGWVVHSPANDTNDWYIEAEIMFVSPTEQRISWRCLNGATSTQGYETAAVDLSATSMDVYLTGKCNSINDTITQTMWVVEVIGERGLN